VSRKKHGEACSAELLLFKLSTEKIKNIDVTQSFCKIFPHYVTAFRSVLR